MDLPPTSATRLRWVDGLFLFALCTILYGISLVTYRTLSTHETSHCITVVEMFENKEWWIPTCGGRPWLERPPLPQWLTGIVPALTNGWYLEWTMRVAPILVSLLTVFVVAWSVAASFGRTIGVMSAACLATMREYAGYSYDAESDIFLCTVVTCTGAMFLRAEAGPRASGFDDQRFLGNRPWYIWVFFLGLGLTNMVKGPLFGASFLGLSLVGYLLLTRDGGILRRYGWLWGWLLCLGVSAIWPIVAWSHDPRVVDLWRSDYGGRWNTNYIGEPWWYYAVHHPWNLFPWTLCAFLGLWSSFRQFRATTHRGMVFVWCWAIIPLVVFSLFRGKHHHYLLNILAPWAVLAAVGGVEWWRIGQRLPNWWRLPWISLALLGLPGVWLLLQFGSKIPGPDYVQTTLLIGWPICAFVVWWLIGLRQARTAFVGICGVFVAINVVAYIHRCRFMDSYEHDVVFMHQVRESTTDEPIYVFTGPGPLDVSWKLYYLRGRGRLLHNPTFLRDSRITAPEILILTRREDEAAMANYGTVEVLQQSHRSRAEATPQDRLTLFRLRFAPDLKRISGDVRVTPLQVTGRVPGPDLMVPE